MAQNKTIGAIGWIDLTVENATEVRDFYKDVVGFTQTAIDMGGYEDYCVNSPENGETIAGICHKRGGNSKIPSQWMMYINVADLDQSMAAVEKGGGKVIDGPRSMGNQGRYCFIEDPAGAVCALFQHLE